jgi:hypothetical protein
VIRLDEQDAHCHGKKKIDEWVQRNWERPEELQND